jgi:ferredoxin
MKPFEAKIFVGFKEYTDKKRNQYILHPISHCESICAQYCNEVGWCVTVTPTTYIYTNGWEDGAMVGIIQYPRFPEDESILKIKALELANRLMEELGQYRVTINFPDEVIMLTNESKIN